MKPLRQFAWLRTMMLLLVATVLITGCTPQGQNDDQSAGERSAGDAADEETASPPETEKQPGPSDQPDMDSADEEDVRLTVIDPHNFHQVLERYRGKVVLVDFWATWCIPCVTQFPHTVEMSRKYADRDLAIISVSLDEPDEETRQQVLDFLKRHEARFENLLSSLGVEEESFEALGIDDGALPHYQLYGRDGRLIRKFRGGDPDSTLAPEEIEFAVIQALANGAPVE